MFIKWNDQAVRLTGRWTRLNDECTDTHHYVKATPAYTTTTAAGSYFELAFTGRNLLLHFDLGYLPQPRPHLWVQLDGGMRMEVPVDRHLRLDAMTGGNHVVKVLYKGGMEQLPRWYAPVMGCVSFIGAEADAPGQLPEDHRKIIEFIGDSITEGVLIDTDYTQVVENTIDQFNRPYQDDNCATYASLTAENLNLRTMFQAYGAIGLTRSGCGAVPRAGLIYPYVCDQVPYTGEAPDIVMINHGANDRTNGPVEYIQRYEAFIDQVRDTHPQALIVCLGAFCGAFDSELRDMVERYNASHATPIHFISTMGWVPAEPLHPTRQGHQTIARNLTPILKKIIEENLR